VFPLVIVVEIPYFIVFVGFHIQGLFPIVLACKRNGFHQGIPEIVSGGVIGANGSTGATPFAEVPFVFGVYLRRPSERLSTKRAARFFRFSVNGEQGRSPGVRHRHKAQAVGDKTLRPESYALYRWLTANKRKSKNVSSPQELYLQKYIYDTVIEANRKMTPSEVEKAVVRASGVGKKTVRLAIKDLVTRGELSYTYIYGTSFLEKSFDRPVRVSNRIVIKPPDKAYQPKGGEVVINIARGAAFGNGTHPTTCLTLRALDFILGDSHYPKRGTPLTGLDVGTGTGILAIALGKFGVQRVVATDIDPCAVSEATHNVFLNGLSEQVTITNTPLVELATSFSVILANLACPTLTRSSSLLSEKLEQDGILILSGFKEPASKDLAKTYSEHGLKLVREEIEHRWAALTLCKTGPG
jgi:ribosomal protein L11 methyltransferase